MGRPLYEGVDWNIQIILTVCLSVCRPLYEGVDWNFDVSFNASYVERRPLYEGVDWNTKAQYNKDNEKKSPSLRGRGLKYPIFTKLSHSFHVALFTRAWIEIAVSYSDYSSESVALFTRAWIEIGEFRVAITAPWSPSLRGRGLKFAFWYLMTISIIVALFTRAWIEIIHHPPDTISCICRPLYEGVDWNLGIISPPFKVRCRPLYEGVDWNR